MLSLYLLHFCNTAEMQGGLRNVLLICSITIGIVQSGVYDWQEREKTCTKESSWWWFCDQKCNQKLITGKVEPSRSWNMKEVMFGSSVILIHVLKEGHVVVIQLTTVWHRNFILHVIPFFFCWSKYVHLFWVYTWKCDPNFLLVWLTADSQAYCCHTCNGGYS